MYRMICLNKKSLFFCLFGVFFLLFCLPCKANEFKEEYLRIATELASVDKDSAILSADALLHSVKEKEQEMKVFLLLATLKESKGDTENAIEDALQALKISKELKNVDWQIRSLGFLATTFRQIGLYNYSEIYLLQAEQLNLQLKDKLIALYIFQEKAFVASEKNHFDEVLSWAQKADSISSLLSPQQQLPVNAATSLYLQGIALFAQGDLEAAKLLFLEGVRILNDKENQVNGFLNLYLGKISLQQNVLDTAKKYFLIAEDVAQLSSNFYLQLETKKMLSVYYKNTGNASKALDYEVAYNDLIRRHNIMIQSVSNNIILEMNGMQEKNNARITIFLIFIVLLSSFTLGLYFYLKKQRLQSELRFKEIINQFKQEQALFNLKRPFALIEKDNNNILEDEIGFVTEEDEKQVEDVVAELAEGEGGLAIPKATQQQLLSGLERFEKGKGYLKPQCSLASVASKLDTNTKYLSYMIHEHKAKDFNKYINELRIKYITSKLITDEKYLDYKIAALAEECGFSSHSKFSKVFKEHTQLSPSVFIEKLIKEGNEIGF
ncbi:MAG TPA: helix-turn-helix domain-containing protein [Edaphocola sp.]|nr:helix-turn-helix domain-containing protein [Edaphocola sp.]